ncbi:putative wall-associated receptor kinase-like 16 [Prunus yedoensis var. nudiflora]|uniref:Putative wall-associated receptor kinase-like 16 n=1 Tax=Prunus yedoensis var. nudiflora TaxID=2094558 RepID=A0A314UIX0_PRUYE|nr:putative wall-associated receptor kinase-like 16 [Prunus yedoensis var. nudiflora]
MELEGMRVTPKQPWGKSEVSSPEDTEYLLGSAMKSDTYFVDVRVDFGSRGATIGTTSGYDSMQIQMQYSAINNILDWTVDFGPKSESDLQMEK